MPIYALNNAFMSLFITCEVFGRISSKFDDINDIMNQYEWYFFPLNVQKILPIILIYAQQPVNIYCFGSIACNRETFKKVKEFNKRNKYEIQTDFILKKNISGCQSSIFIFYAIALICGFNFWRKFNLLKFNSKLKIDYYFDIFTILNKIIMIVH